MFDRKQFDREMDRIRRDQVEDLAGYLANYINRSSHVRERKLNGELDEATAKRLADMPIPATGRDMKEVADELVNDVLERSMALQHPRYFSFVASAVSPYSLAAAVLTDIYNPNMTGWSLAPGACLIEEKLIKWMGSLAGFPAHTCGGLFISGGSMANMSCMMAARTTRLKETEYPIGVAYLSDQTHSSVAKGLRLIGLRRDQIVVIPSDDDFKIRTDLLTEAIDKDLAAGKKPFLAVGTLGTTNTGTIDPLGEMGDICARYGLWFHVDGAYGGSVLISDIYRNLAKGVEKADSLSWDTHKWGLQAYSSSSFIVRDKNNLLDTFTEHPEYLEDVRMAEHNDPWDLGPEMSRPARALKLWFTLQAMGTDKMADVIDYAFYNAKIAQRELIAKGGWELTSKPCCGALTFRYAPPGYPADKLDDLNGAISRKINEDGYTYIVTTTLKGKRVLRLCLINGNTTEEDVVTTIRYLDEIAKSLCK